MQFLSIFKYLNHNIHLVYFNEVCQNDAKSEKSANADFNQQLCIVLSK